MSTAHSVDEMQSAGRDQRRRSEQRVAEASVLVHVADASHPNMLEQIDSVEDTLAETKQPVMTEDGAIYTILQ